MRFYPHQRLHAEIVEVDDGCQLTLIDLDTYDECHFGTVQELTLHSDGFGRLSISLPVEHWGSVILDPLPIESYDFLDAEGRLGSTNLDF